MHEDESTASSSPFLSLLLCPSQARLQNKEAGALDRDSYGLRFWELAVCRVGSWKPFPGLADGCLLPAPSMGLFSAGTSQVSLCVNFLSYEDSSQTGLVPTFMALLHLITSSTKVSFLKESHPQGLGAGTLTRGPGGHTIQPVTSYSPGSPLILFLLNPTLCK